MKKKGIVFLSFVLVLEAQNIDISKFYYRDYLDFGQNKGAFSGNGSTTIMGKDGTQVSVPNVPNFSASSNYGSLTSVGRGFAVTANHVVSFTPEYDSTGVYRKFGLTSYKVSGDREGDSVSQPYGRDEKFTRFDKYIVEGQVSMLDIENSISQGNTETEQKNIQNFKTQLNDFAKDSDGNVYIYQTGSGVITLRNSYSSSTGISRDTNGETRGGGFGTLKQDSINYAKLVYCPSESCENTNVYGMYFTYVPNGDFNNRITTGDSGSGIYAFNQKTNQWVLLGVTSQSTTTNVAYIAAVSNKDLQDYKSKFEQKVDLKITEPNINEWTLTTNNLKYIKRGDTPDKSYTLEKNKDIIFSGNGTMTIQVQENIQLNQDKVGAGGFVFEKVNTETTYKFTNANGGNYFFKGSGLDIGENVKVEWALRNQSGDSLHKIGKGELIVKTDYTPTSTSENLGYLKIGEGKVTLDTDKKAFEGIYITSGRGELALVKDKAEALGATKNGTTSANTINSGATSATSYKLAQDSTDKMGFYFGKGGGKFDLAGNSLVLNTIAANDSKAIITNSNTSTQSTLEIEGLGYANGTKTQNKADTIIHASIGDNANGTNSTPANLNLIHQSNVKTDKSLIFDGNININGKLNTTNSNIVLQGHPTTHATISNADTINKIKNAENGTSKPMPNYMDLSKPSTLNQPDWDSRNFNITGGIDLKNATLTVGKAAHLKADINADTTSQINFGGKHFIDERDGKNVIGSGFSYQQGVESGDLTNETYKDSSYSGKITADGTTITSKFMNFAPNLELKNGAKLNAINLTLNSTNTLNLNGNSTAQVENLIFKDFTNGNFTNKITLNNSKFEVKKSLSFDKSTLNLDTLKTRNNITLPMAYNLYIFNDSNITATSASFQSAKISVQNGASFNAQNLNFAENSTLVLNDKATLTITDILTSKNLSVNASNQSTFTASTLTASGIVNLNADTNSNIKFSTLNLQNGNLQNISQNVAIEKLNLTQSTANLQNLNTNSLKSIDLKNSSNLHFNELNLNDFDKNGLNLTSDDSSKAYIKRLIYDASNARTNGTNTALQSNIVISEKFELKNVGHNLGQNTQGTQNTDDEKLQKDLFTLKFDKNLELGNGAKLDISFAEAVKKDNKDLLFNKDYTIFSANSLTSSNHLQVDFKNSNGTSFGETDFYIKGKLDKDKNAFSVQFVRENPRNFSELNPHIDPSYSPFLEILLQHNDFDKSVDKAVNLSDYSALQERLISLDKSFKDVANSSSNVLETLPLLQRHNINKRIQNQRFTGAKYAYNEERYNPLQKSDFIPALLYLDKMEKEERVWSNVGGGYFTKDESKMSLQSVSVGYDKKLLSNEFLFGVMASITQMQLSHSADEFKQNPQIYSLTFYSNALFGDDELQNELGFSFFNDKRHIGDEELSAGGVGTFFNSLYKFKLSFLPQNFKPLILANVNFNSLNAIDTPTYIQKSYKDLSFDVGLGFELDFEKENGFYNISFIAQQDIYHSKDEVLVSLAKSDKFIPYKSNDPSLSYQLRLMGLENFNNGMFLRYSLSGFIDTKAYKGVSADIQLGYKY
ncbi:Serine protease pet autotransporter [Campylobacter jejuni]|nr:Serine protease pet autotransporter [Campylobacter jejuni]